MQVENIEGYRAVHKLEIQKLFSLTANNFRAERKVVPVPNPKPQNQIRDREGEREMVASGFWSATGATWTFYLLCGKKTGPPASFPIC